MQPPPDPLSQLAMCCGLGQRRRGLKAQRNFYYSPSIAYIDPHSTWPPSSHFGPNLSMAAPGVMQTPHPYFLLAQPVILAGGSSPSHTNTMTLVQTSQAIPSISPMPMTRTLDRNHPSNSLQQQIQHGAIMSSHYAISSNAAGVSAMQTPVISTSSANIYGSSKKLGAHEQFLSPSTNDKYRYGIPTVYESASTYSGLHQQQQTKHKFLSAELLAKLEAIEKQVDLCKEQEIVQRHNIVITRALNPYTLMPHLTNSTLQHYNDYFLISHEYVIRFIEIIKRPGQTLGLYLRSIQFEDQRYGTSREGLIITKIETDSPIYNSQVIHVGDEIISINLIEVQGMSMDDVVVIMSKPRRLVLALRIPKDRDHTICSSLTQRQQQQQFDAHQQSKQSNASNYHMDTYQDGIPRSGINYIPGANRYVANNMYRESSNIGPPSFRDLSKAGPQQQDPGMHHARQLRVQSGMLVNENLEVITPEGFHRLNTSHETAEFPDSFNNEPHVVQSLGRPNFRRINNSTLQRSTIDDLSIDRRISSEIGQSSRVNLRSINQPSVEEDHRFQELDSSQLDQEFKNLVQEAMIDELSVPRSRVEDEPIDSVQKSPVTTASNASLTNNAIPYDTQTGDSVSHTHHIPSVPTESLTRRSLPTRPNIQSANVHNSSDTSVIGVNNTSNDSMKPSAISNIRLGDTPEQSSYFSSSIDAINRELKELRRQRMALSNNETSIDSSKIVDYS